MKNAEQDRLVAVEKIGRERHQQRRAGYRREAAREGARGAARGDGPARARRRPAPETRSRRHERAAASPAQRAGSPERSRNERDPKSGGRRPSRRARARARRRSPRCARASSARLLALCPASPPPDPSPDLTADCAQRGRWNQYFNRPSLYARRPHSSPRAIPSRLALVVKIKRFVSDSRGRFGSSCDRHFAGRRPRHDRRDRGIPVVPGFDAVAARLASRRQVSRPKGKQRALVCYLVHRGISLMDRRQSNWAAPGKKSGLGGMSYGDIVRKTHGLGL